jgi:hypothetical protein
MFPENPKTGDLFTLNNIQYRYNGTRWVAQPSGPPAPTTSVPTTVPPATVPPATESTGAAASTLSPEDQALVQSIVGSIAPWLMNTNENKLRALGQAGIRYVDQQTGRVVRYEGITKTLPGGQTVEPQYFEGDEYNISTLDPVEIRKIQARLQKGGFYLGNNFSMGTVDPQTIAAYSRAMVQANLNFTDVETVIENAQTVPYSSGAGGGLPRYKVTSSADLINVFDRASQDVLGRTLDQEEVSKLVKAYQATELGSLKSRQSVSAQAPTAQAFGQDQIAAENTQEADAYKFSQYAQAFEQLLGR